MLSIRKHTSSLIIPQPEHDLAEQASSSAVSLSNLTLDSDGDDESNVKKRIYRRSSEPPDLVNESAQLTVTPTWDCDFSDDLPPILLSKDIPHLIQDRINQMDPVYRQSDMARVVLESLIVKNTAKDEPSAPRIQVINNIDEEAAPPWEFNYSNSIYFGEGVSLPDYSKLQGCGCRGRCDPRSTTCLCVQRQKKQHPAEVGGFLYDKDGRLVDMAEGYPIFECNALCGCTDDCTNKVSYI